MKKIPVRSKFDPNDCVTIIEFSKISPDVLDAFEEIALKIWNLAENTELFYIKENGNLAILVGSEGCGFSFSTLNYILCKDFDGHYRAEMYDVYPIPDYNGGYAIIYYGLSGHFDDNRVDLVGVAEEDRQRILKLFA